MPSDTFIGSIGLLTTPKSDFCSFARRSQMYLHRDLVRNFSLWVPLYHKGSSKKGLKGVPQ